jgi:hypothetical protein
LAQIVIIAEPAYKATSKSFIVLGGVACTTGKGEFGRGNPYGQA